MHVVVLGAGSWGTTVAAVAARRTATTIWARDEVVADEINSSHANSRYLEGFRLHKRLNATTNLEVAVSNADVLVVGIPSGSFRTVLGTAAGYVRPWVPVVSLTKGFESGTNLRMTQVINELLPGHPAAALTGPNLALEIMARQAAAAVIATEDLSVAARLQEIFQTAMFRVYRNHDVVGCELGGALKNVIAIATGMADGLGVGDNTKAMVMTRGLAELSRLGVAMGGEPETFMGLAGMGDLIATCLSPQSRNRHVGEQLGRGRSLEEILDEMHMVAEGVKTTATVAEMARVYGISMPVCNAIHQVIEGEIGPAEAYRGLTPAAHERDEG
ncbi:MAG: NAD(P)H-dependent glycerol-3-phosphate dehydrogenase [Actinomycetia bacterium]|nr:NAD(P)H-dependent glycerol-3-phosphate dehydrogenase [Actinomycetes bacterium]MCP4958710.1 NAD(P)H-dependent glycerol-3-phosphate dehydrogenase [Actinomycetes bacterium]